MPKRFRGGIGEGRRRLSGRSRDNLAAMQSALAEALMGGDSVPGFNPARVDLARRALIAKRRKSVARIIPSIVGELGTEFERLFDEFAMSSPPAESVSDALRFTDRLCFRHLAEIAVREVVRLDLRSRRRFRGTRSAGGWVVGVRLPVLGIRLLGIPGTRRG